MSELNIEQIIKALECCIGPVICNCMECPYRRIGCKGVLIKDALALIKEQDTAYNELYELTESYRKELVSVKADTVRKMRERLKYTLCINNEENTEIFDYAYTLETIDQIAKEMLEEKE